VAADDADAWTTATADQYGSQQLLGVETIDPTPRLATALRLGPSEQVVVRRRLMSLRGKPVEIANSYYPASLAAGTPLAEQAKIRGGAPRALEALGAKVAYADEDVELEASPSQAEAELLQISQATRVVRLFRTAYTATDLPVEVADSVIIPAGRKLRHRITVS